MFVVTWSISDGARATGRKGQPGCQGGTAQQAILARRMYTLKRRRQCLTPKSGSPVVGFQATRGDIFI